MHGTYCDPSEDRSGDGEGLEVVRRVGLPLLLYFKQQLSLSVRTAHTIHNNLQEDHHQDQKEEQGKEVKVKEVPVCLMKWIFFTIGKI